MSVPTRSDRRALALWLALVSATLLGETATRAEGNASPTATPEFPFDSPFTRSQHSLVRGMTIGPIESTLHPDVGYGTGACADALHTASRLGANWVSLTPFGRVWDLSPSGIDLTFETPFDRNRQAVNKTVAQAHARGLKVMLVPHLWVEKGGWRGEIDFDDDASWQRFSDAYRAFVTTWATIADEAGVDLFSMGVELRSWVTTTRAPSFAPVVAAVREVYHGPLTYAANWDDAEHTVIWGDLDVIGINAFYPLAKNEDATLAQLLDGSKEVAARAEQLAQLWRKPILFTEIGYTNRPDPALRPWEWPEDLDAATDPSAQADAYHALLAGFVERPWFAGFFVWRMYADPWDTSQEPAWGFSPLYREAELVLRDAYATRWAYEASPHSALQSHRATSVGAY